MLEWVFGEREGLVVARCGEDWTGPMHNVPDSPPLPPEPRRLRPHQYLGMFFRPGHADLYGYTHDILRRIRDPYVGSYRKAVAMDAVDMLEHTFDLV
jgi:hypothetical protein